jgi:elongation factor G
MVIAGMGDPHVQLAIQKVQDDAKVGIQLREPKIPYRETIRAIGDYRYRHKKQTGGRGQFAEVAMRVEPLPAEAEDSYEFVSEVVGGNIPKNYLPACEKGVIDAMKAGPLAKCKVINIRAVVYDGKHHEVDSSDMAFQIAARSAFREGMLQASPILLEPVMKIRIIAPDQYMGDISGDLNARRGRIMGMETEEGLQVTLAEIPEAETFGYSNRLRSLTQGRGSFDMEFVRYEEVPSHVADEIRKKVAAQDENE